MRDMHWRSRCPNFTALRTPVLQRLYRESYSSSYTAFDASFLPGLSHTIQYSVDSASIPAHLRGHVHPSVRRLYPNTSTLEPRTVTAPAEIAIENRRLHAENCALETTCGMWRRRAEAHAAATLGLLELARSTRDQAENMRRERDEVYKHYDLLREKLPEADPCPPLLMCNMKLSPSPQTIVEAASHDTYNSTWTKGKSCVTHLTIDSHRDFTIVIRVSQAPSVSFSAGLAFPCFF